MGKNDKLVEVAFKGERKAIYRNRNEIDVKIGDRVIVEADRGSDLGTIVFTGNQVHLKRGKGETKGLVRLATEKDLEIHDNNKRKEKDAKKCCLEKIENFKLEMKLVDVEVQFDGSKITFFFTAAQRVDFRALVKELASVYRTRIELRQIGVRDEAKRLCGIGICGRVQCCSAFLNEFEQITTQLAKDQQLSLNPSKISGNCGRLLCCLRYEEDEYLKVTKHFPELGSLVKINKKRGRLFFISVFENKGQVHFEDNTYEWFAAKELNKGLISDEQKN